MPNIFQIGPAIFELQPFKVKNGQNRGYLSVRVPSKKFSFHTKKKFWSQFFPHNQQCLYSKLQLSKLNGVVWYETCPNFEHFSFCPVQKLARLRNLKIPPFTRFARPCGGLKALRAWLGRVGASGETEESLDPVALSNCQRFRLLKPPKWPKTAKKGTLRSECQPKFKNLKIKIFRNIIVHMHAKYFLDWSSHL